MTKGLVGPNKPSTSKAQSTYNEPIIQHDHLIAFLFHFKLLTRGLAHKNRKIGGRNHLCKSELPVAL